MLLLEFASYIWFFYFTHTDIENESVLDFWLALIASGLTPVLSKHLVVGDIRQRCDEL